MNPPHIERTFCTTKEAATLLGVSVGTVQLWVESGLLQAWKTAGGHRRVMRESVERLLHKAAVPAPAAPAAAAVAGGAASQPAASAPQETSKLSVLVVEDDATLLRLYQAQLSAWPMAPRVQQTSDGFAALLMMGRNPPDLLITDLRMPGIDGFAMLRALQKVPEAAQTRIVVVSGLEPSEIEAQGGVPAGVEVLGKPVPFARLLQIGSEVLMARQAAAARAS